MPECSVPLIVNQDQEADERLPARIIARFRAQQKINQGVKAREGVKQSERL